MNIKLLLLTLVLTGCGKAPIETDYRAVASTIWSVAVIQPDGSTPPDIDDVEDDCPCEGTGTIRHGDGHVTPCPCGEGCTCGTGTTFSAKDEEVSKEGVGVGHDNLVYIFGGPACIHCQRMEENVFPHCQAELSQFDKVYHFDSFNPDHRKYFDYYNVNEMPTVIVVENKAYQEIRRMTGYVGVEELRSFLGDF